MASGSSWQNKPWSDDHRQLKQAQFDQSQFENQILAFQPQTVELAQQFVSSLKDALIRISLHLHLPTMPSSSSNPTRDDRRAIDSITDAAFRSSSYSTQSPAGPSASASHSNYRTPTGKYRHPPGRNRSLPNRDATAGAKSLSAPEQCNIRGCNYYGTAVHSHQSAYDRASYDRRPRPPMSSSGTGANPMDTGEDEDGESKEDKDEESKDPGVPPQPNLPPLPPPPPVPLSEQKKSEDEKKLKTAEDNAAKKKADEKKEEPEKKKQPEKKKEEREKKDVQGDEKRIGSQRSQGAPAEPFSPRNSSLPSAVSRSRVLVHPDRISRISAASTAANHVLKLRNPRSPLPSAVRAPPSKASPLLEPSAKKPRPEAPLPSTLPLPSALASSPSSSSSSSSSSNNTSHATPSQQC
jgi:hypothetical protein